MFLYIKLQYVENDKETTLEKIEIKKTINYHNVIYYNIIIC